MADLSEETLNKEVGEETNSSDSSTELDQAIIEAFETGFDDGDEKPSDSDSKPDAKNNEKEANPKNKAEKSDEKSDSTDGAVKEKQRPEKRSRTAQARIAELTSERNKLVQELESLRTEKATREAGANELPTADENGNYDAKDFADYQKKLAENAADQKIKELESRLANQELERTMVEVSGKIENVTRSATEKYQILNDKSEKFNPEVASLVRQRVLEVVTPFANGSKEQLVDLADLVEDTIESTMKAVEAARSSAMSRRSKSMDELENGFAMVSTGAKKSPEETVESVFNKIFDSSDD